MKKLAENSYSPQEGANLFVWMEKQQNKKSSSMFWTSKKKSKHSWLI